MVKRRSKVHKAAGKASVPLAPDMYDEVDTFHREKDTVFDDDDIVSEDGDDDDEVDGILGLSDSDVDSDADLEAGGKLAKSAHPD
jgi:hypothetical protein